MRVEMANSAGGTPALPTVHPDSNRRCQSPTATMPAPKQPFLTFGLPFLTFMVLAHRGLAYIGQGRHEVRPRT